MLIYATDVQIISDVIIINCHICKQTLFVFSVKIVFNYLFNLFICGFIHYKCFNIAELNNCTTLLLNKFNLLNIIISNKLNYI